MAKLTLETAASGYGLPTTINANKTLLEAAIENTLSRDGTAPNQMGAQLDMNSQRIVNLPDAVANQEPITLAQAASIAGVDNPLTQETVGAVLYPRTSEEVSASITPTNYYYAPGHIRRYGSVGDGATDDTTAVQSALNSGTGTVVGDPRDTYRVTRQGSLTVDSVAQGYCLLIPDNTDFDLNGSTLFLGAAENAALILNSTAGTTQNADITIRNGTIDGNKANQTAPGAGDMACIFLHNVLRARGHDIKATNVRQYAGRFLACTKSVFYNLFCTDSDGDGWSFGTTANSTQLVNCFVDKIEATSCLGTYSGLAGNPFICVMQDSHIGSVVGSNSAGGVKVQDDSRNLNIDSLSFYGSTNGSGNSGVKIQGNSGSSLYPRGINVANINSRGCWGAGLFVSVTESVSIGQYSGRDNGGGGGTGSEEFDVDIDTTNGNGANSIQIGSIYSENNGNTVAVRLQGTGRFQIGTIQLYNPVGIGVQNTSSGRCNIGSIGHVDDAGTPTTTYVYRQTGDARGHIGSIETNLAHSTSQSRVRINTGLYNMTIGKIRLGSTDNLEGIVALTNASTTTAVTCGHIWRDYVGGTSDYFHPIIQLIPVDSTSAALGGMRATVTDGSSGTGFTINHASATTGDDVYWKVVGWTNLTQAVV